MMAVMASALTVAGGLTYGWTADGDLPVPRLAQSPVIDGDLGDWRERAFTDGEWDMDRLRASPWFDARVNRLTLHLGETPEDDDLRATYYLAWDSVYVYLGAEVHDNVNDVDDPEHEPKRWYYKDCVCWFIEAPRDAVSESFGRGDNAFCFVADTTRPAYAAWWRHGTQGSTYVEEPLPPSAVDWALVMDPWGQSAGDFVLEARVRMAETFGRSDPSWTPPRAGDVYGLEIVHTDPDGEGYGGHFLVYGRGDDDATWGRVVLVDEVGASAAGRSSWGTVKRDTGDTAGVAPR